MTTAKNIDELTLDEIKEQMALYHRLYYKKRKEEPEFMDRKRELDRKKYHEKKEAKGETVKKQNRKYPSENLMLIKPAS